MLRNAVAHYADFLHGAGRTQVDATSPHAFHGLSDVDTFYYSIAQNLSPLEIDLGRAADEAFILEAAIIQMLTAARARRERLQ